ncbi:MAG: hypothetical protein PPP58_12655 [Natronomonas sp.]
MKSPIRPDGGDRKRRSQSADAVQEWFPLDSEDLRTIVEHYDDPDHPEALSVSEVFDRLAAVQTTIDGDWSAWLDLIEDRQLVVVSHDSLVVLTDRSRRRWPDLLEEVGIEDEVARTIVRVAHHYAGRRQTDREFDDEDAIVFKLPEDQTRHFADAVVESLISEGLTTEEAEVHYGLDIRGRDRDRIRQRHGYDDPMELVDVAQRAREKRRSDW